MSLVAAGALVLCATVIASASDVGGQESTGATIPAQAEDLLPSPDSSAGWGSLLIILVPAIVAVVAGWRLRLYRLSALRPDEREGPEWLLLIGVGLLVWLGQGLGAGTALVLTGMGEAEQDTLRGTALMLLGGVGGGLIAFGAVWFAMPRAVIASIGMACRAWDALRGVGWFLVVMPLVLVAGIIATAFASWLAQRSGDPLPDPVAHETLRKLSEPGAPTGPDALWWWLIVGGVVVLIPVVEEVIYRGCLQRAIRGAITGRSETLGELERWGAVLGASALFAVMHAGITDWHGLVPLFVLSVGFGAAYERTGKLIVPIVMHGLFNAANVGMGFLGAG